MGTSFSCNHTVTNVFNIRSSIPFWDTLAELYLHKYHDNLLALANVLFLLPNRRSCQMLTAAFVRKQGLKPTILPQMTPISELDDDEVFFNGFSYTKIFDEESHPISKEERLFLFMRLIMSKPNDFGLKRLNLAQAYALANDLATLIDDACNQGLSFDRLQDLVPDKYATHWQETLKLLKIITEYWPQILQERNAIDRCMLKNKILYLQADLWQEKPTMQDVVAAGITASFPAIVSLLKSILKLPNGSIYFACIDRYADDDYWTGVDETHPLYENKILLELLGLSPAAIQDISTPVYPLREQLVSELMRPASVSYMWRSISEKISVAEAINGITFINCDSQRDEALAIALKMRAVLEIPEKTAALITYDRNLARRVAAELMRFDIEIDDSAGMPLSLSQVGIFFRLIAEAAEDIESEIKFVTLLKHPFMLCQHDAASFRKAVYTYETALRTQTISSLSENILSLVSRIKTQLDAFRQFLISSSYQFENILEKHICLAENFASSNTEAGSRLLWKGNAGRTAANFVTKILTRAATLGSIDGKDYLPLLTEMMGAESIRSNYGTHPRLSILGPIEARLCHFDVVILGEFNEGIWPKAVDADMWMSRPMKKDFGFNLPEKNIGILASDLCCFLAAPSVILTRAKRVDGTPMKKSRWLLRMETVLKASGMDITTLSDNSIYQFIHSLDIPDHPAPIKAPAPCPPVSSRPRKLSASGVDLLVQDPYSVYAKYILKLYPLDDLDKEPDQRDYGTLIHGIIEDFNTIYPQALPENALEKLIAIGQKHFADAGLSKDLEAFWWPKFTDTAAWIIEQETAYRLNVAKIHNEISGEIVYLLPGGEFKFTAKADRLDELKNGNFNILDYKTGKIPSKKQIMSGHALQLPLEGLIATKGKFTGLNNTAVQNMIYWQLGVSALSFSPKEADILEKSENYLLELITTFDFETTPYHSRPVPKFVPKNKDYEHLARIKEWSIQEDGENGDDE